MYYTASSTVQASVLALRNETVLASPPKGAVDYVVSSGSRVASGGTVANVYESEDQISAVHQMQQIDSAVSRLQSLQQQGSAYSFSAATANERICQKLTDILGSIGSGEMDQAESQKSALLTLLNEKEIGTGEVKNFSTRISALQTERNKLEKQAGTPVGTVVSPQAGYFIQSTDGMERAYDISKVGSITCADVKNLQAAKLTPVSGAAGKSVRISTGISSARSRLISWCRSVSWIRATASLFSFRLPPICLWPSRSKRLMLRRTARRERWYSSARR